MNFIVGLTGGIGSGKSCVADVFAGVGVRVVDTDAIARELTAPGGAVLPEITALFGQQMLASDGSLDRAAMRRLCFADGTARKRLEAILHPRIRQESVARCRLEDGAPYVLLVVPLLVESGAYHHVVDRILVVDCDEATQVARVMTRSGLSAAEVRAIMATQATRAERLAAADDVLVNDTEHAQLAARVLAQHREYLAKAKALSGAACSD